MTPTMYAIPDKPHILVNWTGKVKKWAAAASSASSAGSAEEEEEVELLAEGSSVVLSGDPETIFRVVGFAAAGARVHLQEMQSQESREVPRGQIQGCLADCHLWDLPGGGTPNFSSESYVKNVGMRYFDAVICVAGNRFTEADQTILQELRKFSVPFLVVRSQVDKAVQQ